MRTHPLWHLSLAKIREFLREPEAVFWVFVFPVLLTLALGIAFRAKGPDTVGIGVQAGSGAEEAVVRPGELARPSGGDSRRDGGAESPPLGARRARRRPGKPGHLLARSDTTGEPGGAPRGG